MSDIEQVYTDTKSIDSSDLIRQLAGGGNSKESPVLQASEEQVPEAASEPTAKAQEIAEEAPETPVVKASNLRKIQVSDEKGRREVEVDFNDLEKLDNYIQLAHGARKWQAELGQAKKQSEANSEELKKYKTSFLALEDAFSGEGVAGVVDLLSGKKGGYKDWIQKEIDRQKFLDLASPDQVAALESRERADKLVRDMEIERKKNEEFRKQVASEREAAELKSIESKVTPLFDRYKFEGKLGAGNTRDEELLDRMLWKTVMDNLDELPSDELDVATIEKEFRDVSQALRRQVHVGAEKRASKIVEQKKKEASRDLQSAIKSNYGSADARLKKEVDDILGQSDYTKLISGFGRLKSIFN